MKKFAFVFAGQGSQSLGMGVDLYKNSRAAKKVFDTADEVLGRKISDICFSGTDEELAKTINSQPCILTTAIAAYEAFKEKLNITPVFTAGHSLGEYAALYTAGVVDLKTVLLLIQKRACLMNDIAEKSNGGMAAVLGLDNDTVINLTNKKDNIFVANFNSNGQVVITGDKQAILNSVEEFKAAGAKRVIPLAVSGAFHSPYMKEAGVLFSDFIDDYVFNNANMPVYTNTDAKATVLADEFKEKLPKQIYTSVHWTQTINNIVNNGVVDFIEFGSGKVLAGLNKKINSEINTINISDIDSLNKAIEEIRQKELV